MAACEEGGISSTASSSLIFGGRRPADSIPVALGVLPRLSGVPIA
jgi:hypothetical protein